jgi:hypothetical protein
MAIGWGACAGPGRGAYPHYCSLLDEVDSAEAEQVGSQGIRFCAYTAVSSYEGVRHYRTTPGALISSGELSVRFGVIAGCGSQRRADQPVDTTYSGIVGMPATSADSAAPSGLLASLATAAVSARLAHANTCCVASPLHLPSLVTAPLIPSVAGY